MTTVPPQAGVSTITSDAVLRRFVNSVRQEYGARLHRVVLYGSRARGDATAESDVDVLVVLDDCDDFWAELRKVGTLAYEASKDAEVIVSAFPMARYDFEHRRSPLLLNIRREGIAVA